MTLLRTLLVDDAVVIVDKPPGLASDVTPDPARPHLRALLAAQLGLDPASLLVVHRLDRDTSGVIVLARTRAAAAALTEQFRARTTRKLYLAICACMREHACAASARWTIDNHLRAPKTGRGRTEIVRAGGDRAITEVHIVEKTVAGALIEARPQTGRTHQIRVHLADAGYPIVGDTLYAPADVAAFASRTMLHARSLQFVHPVTGRSVVAEAEPGADFTDALARMRSCEPFRPVRPQPAARPPANTRAGNRRR